LKANKRKIVVIGGGASGLMAAARAAELGSDVVVLEKMDRPARKVLITGNGRCNVTTGHDAKTAISSFGANGRFLHGAFSKFYSEDMIALLDSLGVRVKIENGKRYFPVSNKAADIAAALIKKVTDSGGRIVTGRKVIEISVGDGRVCGVETLDRTKNEKAYLQTYADGRDDDVLGLYIADAVILATGGMSYPSTGSSGDGYRLARVLGHSIIEPRAALVPIELQGSLHKELSPLALENASVRLEENGKVLAEETGEMMFSHFGVTGPTVINLGKCVSGRKSAAKLKLVVNFMPALDAEQLRARLAREMNAAGIKSVNVILSKILPKRVAPVFLRLAGISEDRKCCEVTKTERDGLARLLNGMEFQVKGTRPIEEAMVTAGGVRLKEVDPRTMESKIVKGLYICGELLDVDGPSGGFNLQAAFSTGRLAGESAAAE
jgi:predicted flavoprotein YhiN